MAMRKTAIVLIVLFCVVDPVIANNSHFRGIYAIDLTLGDPACRQTSGAIEIGSNSEKKENVYYLYLPETERQYSYTFTTDDGHVYNRILTVLDENRLRFYQNKKASAYSTKIDLLFIFTDEYRSFTATGSIIGQLSCSGPAFYIGDKIGENDGRGDDLRIQKELLDHENTAETGSNIW